MKILVTGAKGQVGFEIASLAKSMGHDVIAADSSTLDITDAARVHEYVSASAPDWVVNTAAWTAVDQAEAEEKRVYAVNAAGAGNVASACRRCSVPMLHFSTDYVFDGAKSGAYTEDDEPRPLSVYGRSKFEGEIAISSRLQEHIILRTSWIFSARRSNFVRTMLRLGAERERLTIVDDQVGKPTSARQLAEMTLRVIDRDGPRWGIYHVAQSPETSWHGFAMEIFSRGRALGLPLIVNEVVPTSSSQYGAAAPRPLNSVLDCSRFEETFEVTVGDWHDALPQLIEEIVDGGIFA